MASKKGRITYGKADKRMILDELERRQLGSQMSIFDSMIGKISQLQDIVMTKPNPGISREQYKKITGKDYVG